MKLSKLLPFGFVMYNAIWRIRDIQKEIRRYRASGEHDLEVEAIKRAENQWGRYLIEKGNITIRVTGQEHVPDGPVVFVSNHQGYCDIPIFTAAILDKQFGFVAKKDLFDIPFYGKWLRDVRCVMIDREDVRSSLKTIDEGIELLKQGFSLGIFPEGTRSKGPQMGEFKKGSLRLATKPGVPVVPVTISGSYKCMEQQGYVVPATVDFCIHPAIETAGMGRKEAGELSERVEKIIRDKLIQLQAAEAAEGL